MEHLLSAFCGLNIRNAGVRLDEGNEIPIMNGSSDVFFEKLRSSGDFVRKTANAVHIEDAVTIRDPRDGSRYLTVTPADHGIMRISSKVGYSNSPVESQSFDFDFDSPEGYFREISKARTSYPFFLRNEVEKNALFERLKGLRYRGDDKNVNVLDPEFVSGSNYENEIARHKILDFLGDFHVANMPFAH